MDKPTRGYESILQRLRQAVSAAEEARSRARLEAEKRAKQEAAATRDPVNHAEIVRLLKNYRPYTN